MCVTSKLNFSVEIDEGRYGVFQICGPAFTHLTKFKEGISHLPKQSTRIPKHHNKATNRVELFQCSHQDVNCVWARNKPIVCTARNVYAPAYEPSRKVEPGLKLNRKRWKNVHVANKNACTTSMCHVLKSVAPVSPRKEISISPAQGYELRKERHTKYSNRTIHRRPPRSFGDK